jgi:hypothetical protein
VDKRLTPEEASHGVPLPREAYLSVMALGRKLQEQGNPTVLLSDVFKNETGTIYGDHVHCKFDEFGNSRGYDIMSERIVENLARLWHLKRKKL